MCTHKTLTQGSNGYIVLCLKCNRYQLAFGTSLINLEDNDYNLLYSLIKEQYRYNKNSGFPNHKTIHLPTFSATTEIVLSFIELEILLEMFTEANIMLQVETILNVAST